MTETIETDTDVIQLKKWLEETDFKVYTKVLHVAKSGMMRTIAPYVIVENNPINISWYIEKLGIAYRYKDYDGVRMNGCGMDMGFQLVYNLSRVLYHDNFICTGEKCTSNDHVNGMKRKVGVKHSDAGYKLKQIWF